MAARDDRPPDFLADGLSAFAWAIENVELAAPDRGEDPLGHAAAMMNYRRMSYEYAAYAARVCADGRAVLYRALELPAGLPWKSTVELGRLGVFWSARMGGARVYGSVAHPPPTETVVLECFAPPSSIDWPSAFEAFLGWGEDEWEVTLRCDNSVWLVRVGRRSLPRPVKGNTGPSDRCR